MYLYHFLDYEDHSKRSDDVLDVILRQKYNETNITFKSIADLRRDLASQEALSVLELIKSYQAKRKSESKKDQVKIMFR